MALLNDLLNLDLTDSTEEIIAEYIWIDRCGKMRSKATTLPGSASDPKELPKWKYDGSSAGQGPGEKIDVVLHPRAVFKDPFRRGNNILAFGRDIVNSHSKACLYAGIAIKGVNGEVMPGKWAFQVGPAVGISAGDQMWVAHYILERIAEIADLFLEMGSNPFMRGDPKRDFCCYINYSTKSMRRSGGTDEIRSAIDKLGGTAEIHTFPWAIADQRGSVRVGYFCRRSAPEPYGHTSSIAYNTILREPQNREEAAAVAAAEIRR